MANAEYFKLREQVISAANSMDGVSPCQAGKATCCIIGAPISREEVEVLRGALGQGDISQDVIEAANVNARDIKRTACVFLDDTTRTCRIYPYRPLECIDFGRGAYPKTTSGWEACSSTQEQENEVIFRPPDALPRLCKECQIQVDPAIPVPLSVMTSSLAVTRYYKREIGNMRLDHAARLLHQSLNSDNTG